MKDKQFEWKEQTKLLKQAIYMRGSYGNYGALVLPEGRFVILDRKNLKFLLPSSGSLYTLPGDWEKWMKRGFIVVALRRAFHLFKYYIFSAHDKRFIVKAKEVKAYKFLESKSDYFVVRNDDLKEAIFNKNGEQISDWFDWISEYGLTEGESEYYMANKNGKEAIFYKDGKQVTEWFDGVLSYGLVKGQSDYYIAIKKGKEAIFHKDGQQITDWYSDIDESGLVKGQSDFYVARKGGKAAIFHKDGYQATDWFDSIYSNGFVEGQSDFYIARKKGKAAIFDKSGSQISDWFDDIYSYGLVDGQTDYYLVKVDKLFYICKLGSTKVVGPFDYIWDYGFIGFIKDPSQNTIRIKMLDNQQKTLTRQEMDDFFEGKEMENER
jgi:antitoxin component YwqK of YwqJK toxin-antitoxin module